MKIAITGANGFIGKHMMTELMQHEHEIFAITRDTQEEQLAHALKNCDFVYHFAAVNRSEDEKQFENSNVLLTEKIVQLLQKYKNNAPILATSSVHADAENAYGTSKKRMEQLLWRHAQQNASPVYIYRLPNVFGKWSKPHYNSVVATFCWRLTRGLPIDVHDPKTMLMLCYIDDVVEEFMQALQGCPTMNGQFCTVAKRYTMTLGELAQKLHMFQQSRDNLSIIQVNDALTKKLYSTYMSFLPEQEFVYDLNMHVDTRGSFTEFMRTAAHGQVSVNVSKPGVTKGNHWHHTKLEKFLVVKGEALITFRRIDDETVYTYEVSGDKLQVVDIPAGYTHAITNVGDGDLITVMWANECFNPEKPDTYYLEV